jgi:predicted dehydrogenase
MTDQTRRTFLKQAALGTAAALTFSPASVLGANDRVRVGMIGVGDRGNDLLDQVLKVHGVEVVAMADVYSRRRDQVKSKVPDIQTFDEYRRLLDMKDLDGIIVASPLHIHTKHFLDTLASGKDLYCEKTMTWSIPEADSCVAAARTANRVVQIGLQHQSSGALVDVKQWIKDGWLGKITAVESWMSRNTPHGKGQWVRPVPSDCTMQNVDWSAFLNGRPDRPFDPFRLINWRLYWEFSGGNVAENMVHQIAWIMSALSLPVPSAAYMSGGVFSEKDGREVPDTIAVTFEFPDDIVVTWQSTFSNKHYGMANRILGSDGTIEHRFEEGVQYWPEKTNRPDGEETKGKTKDDDHMRNWIECIRSRNAPNAPVEVGYRSAMAVHMANLSYRHKRRILLSEAKVFPAQYQP